MSGVSRLRDSRDLASAASYGEEGVCLIDSSESRADSRTSDLVFNLSKRQRGLRTKVDDPGRR